MTRAPSSCAAVRQASRPSPTCGWPPPTRTAWCARTWTATAGWLDLVFGGFGEPDLLFFHGGPDGFDAANPRRLRMEHDGVVYDEPRFLCAADLNGDGWLDLVVPQIAADRSFILWGGPDGYSMERCRPLSVFHAVAARAADLDGDGRLDLVVAGHTQSESGPDDAFLYVYWNGPGGLREDRRTLLPARAGNSVSIADFDNDGLLDLFVSSYTTPRERDLDSFIYWNRPGRGFSPDDCTRLFTHSASGSLAADLNGNGWTDLVVANHKVWGDHRGYSEIWWNGPAGSTAAAPRGCRPWGRTACARSSRATSTTEGRRSSTPRPSLAAGTGRG